MKEMTVKRLRDFLNEEHARWGDKLDDCFVMINDDVRDLAETADSVPLADEPCIATWSDGDESYGELQLFPTHKVTHGQDL